MPSEYEPDLAFFLAITPWPYTDLYREVADRVEVHDYSKYNLINPIIQPAAMTRQELSAAMGQAFASFYSRKMRRLAQMPPDKRDYLQKVTRLLMEESYLSERGLGRDGGHGTRRQTPGRRRSPGRRHADAPRDAGGSAHGRGRPREPAAPQSRCTGRAAPWMSRSPYGASSLP